MVDSKNPLLTASYATLFSMWAYSYYYVLPMSPNVVITATLIVYIGSHRSLRLLATEAEGGVASNDKEVMSTKDAAQFPIVGSCALFGLFVAFKYFDKDTVNIILGVYFGIVGFISMIGTLGPFFETFIQSKNTYGFKKTLPYIGELDCLLTPAELVAIIPSAIFSIYYFKTKHYMLNNLFGISFCVQSIERMSIGSYKIGAILLSGLFIYDIFWVFGSEKVFGSNVMVTVAKSFDGPIKLLFPKTFPGGDITVALSSTIDNAKNSTLLSSLEYSEDCSTFVYDISHMLGQHGSNTTKEFANHALSYSRNIVVESLKNENNCTSIVSKVMSPLSIVMEGEFSLLGLGDIVIPGLFIAILLRFDAVQAGVTGLYGEHQKFSKPYFHLNIIFYALGLVITLYVMNTFKAAQPALLYLVPACLLASLLVARYEKNFPLLLEYNEEVDEDQAEDSKKEIEDKKEK